MNKELMFAIEELQVRSHQKPWFLPVLLSECDVPARSIGAGETLLDIQFVPLHKDWDKGIERLVKVINPISPSVQNLIETVKLGANPALRQNATSALAKIANLDSVPTLIEALRDENPGVRKEAIEALTKIKDERIIRAITEFSYDYGADLLVKVIKAIANNGHKAAPFLIEKLKHPSLNVRQQAITELGRLGISDAVPNLIEKLKEAHPYIRSCTAVALGKIGDRDAIPGLLAVLKDEYPYVRAEAIRALSKLRAFQQVEDILWLEILNDEDTKVRLQAIDAIGKLGEKAIPTLIETLSDKNPKILRRAARRLSYFNDTRVISALLDLLKRDGTKRLRKIIISAFGRIGDSRVIPVLIQALNDNDHRIRLKVIESLGNIGDESTVAPLIRTLQSDPNVRAETISALKSIGTPTAVEAIKENEAKTNREYEAILKHQNSK